jgi:hypothetical protein
MDHPLYGAALYLNPRKFFEIQKKGDDRTVAELRSCFNDVLTRMDPNEKFGARLMSMQCFMRTNEGLSFQT